MAEHFDGAGAFRVSGLPMPMFEADIDPAVRP